VKNLSSKYIIKYISQFLLTQDLYTISTTLYYHFDIYRIVKFDHGG